MEILKALALNGISTLLGLIVAFFLLRLFAGKKQGCGCGGSCGGGAAATEQVDPLMPQY